MPVATSWQVSSESQVLPGGQAIAQNFSLPAISTQSALAGQLDALVHGSQMFGSSSGEGSPARVPASFAVPPRSTLAPQAVKPTLAMTRAVDTHAQLSRSEPGITAPVRPRARERAPHGGSSGWR